MLRWVPRMLLLRGMVLGGAFIALVAPWAVGSDKPGALAVMSVDTSGQPSAAVQTASWVDVTADAVQTFYKAGVPHTDRAGNPRLEYDPSASFFPIGLYLPQPCMVSMEFSWPSFEGDPAWDGTYTLIVNLGSSQDTSSPDVIGFWENEGANLSGTAERLPATTELYYSVWPTGVYQTVAEGPFTSDQCPPDDPDDPNALETMARAGFNLALVSNPSVFLALKAEAPEASQMKLVVGGIGAFGTFRDDLFQAFKGEGTSGDPDVYGWYIGDEPDFCLSTSECSERLDQVRTIYAEHEAQTSEVFFLTAGPGLTTYDWPWWPEFIQAGDVASHCNYPGFWRLYLPTVRRIADTVSQQTKIVGEAKPSWVVLGSMASERFPTPTEMRAMAYTAIVHGATGIWQFIWDSFMARDGGIVGIRPDTPALYSETIRPDAAVATQRQITESVALWNSLDSSRGGLNAELKTLEPVIFAPTADSSDRFWAYSVLVDHKPNRWSPIRTMLKTVGGEQYLIAVNMDNASVNAQFRFVQGIASVDVMFENGRRIISYAGGFTDHFDPLAVHVYRFSFGCFEPRSAPDYVVNILDLWRVAIRANRHAQEEDYDVDRDGAVTLMDVMLVARNLGTVCPH